MKATAHTEVYRPWSGRVEEGRLRFAPLLRTLVRTSVKRKLPLIVLYAPVVIGTIIFSFVVYAGFAIGQGETPSALGQGGDLIGALTSRMVSSTARQLLDVRDKVVGFHLATNVFSLFVVAWYGAGQIAEDRRLGAHLLYFARPIDRRDYLLAKFLTVAFFGALASVVPGLVICSVAVFASPEWSFLTEQWRVIVHTVTFGALTATLLASIVLAVSSLASRRTFALLGVFGYVLVSAALGRLLAVLQHERDFLAINPLQSCARVAGWLFGLKRNFPRIELTWALVSIGVTLLVAWWILWRRVRRMEVVA